jgi:hypothetical protein
MLVNGHRSTHHPQLHSVDDKLSVPRRGLLSILRLIPPGDNGIQGVTGAPVLQAYGTGHGVEDPAAFYSPPPMTGIGHVPLRSARPQERPATPLPHDDDNAADHLATSDVDEPREDHQQDNGETGTWENHDGLLVRWFNQKSDFPWMHLKVAMPKEDRPALRFPRTQPPRPSQLTESDPKPHLGGAIRRSPLTEEGVCASLTCHYMRMHVQGREDGFFDWVRTPKGISSVMNDQLKYEGYRRRRLGIRLQETAAADFDGVMGGLLEDAGLSYEHSTVENFVSKDFVLSVSQYDPQLAAVRLYRVIHLKLDDDSRHVVGVVLDIEAGHFTFIDTNIGVFRTTSFERFQQTLFNVARQSYDDVVQFAKLTYSNGMIGIAGMNIVSSPIS